MLWQKRTEFKPRTYLLSFLSKFLFFSWWQSRACRKHLHFRVAVTPFTPCHLYYMFTLSYTSSIFDANICLAVSLDVCLLDRKTNSHKHKYFRKSNLIFYRTHSTQQASTQVIQKKVKQLLIFPPLGRNISTEIIEPSGLEWTQEHLLGQNISHFYYTFLCFQLWMCLSSSNLL